MTSHTRPDDDPQLDRDLKQALDCLRPCRGDRDDSLWLLLISGARVQTLVEIEGGVRPDDDRYCTNLVELLDEIPAEQVALVVPRYDGRPRPADRQMWRRMRHDGAGRRVTYQGMIVVGRSGWSWVDGGADPGAVGALA